MTSLSTSSMIRPTIRDPVRQMINEIVNEFEDPLFSSPWTSTVPTWGGAIERPRGTAKTSAMTCMRLDAYETDTGFHVHCECAGVPKEKIECSIENNLLTIKIKKEPPADYDETMARCKERCFGPCQRSIALPGNVDKDGVQCTNKDGVICVDFPKLGGTVAAKKLAIE